METQTFTSNTVTVEQAREWGVGEQVEMDGEMFTVVRRTSSQVFVATVSTSMWFEV